MLGYLKLQHARFRSVRAYQHGDWRTLPIRENGERLAQVDPAFCHAYYAREMKIGSDDRIFVRKSVLERYHVARDILKRQGFGLVVYDGWRSTEVQENLFWFYLRKFTAAKFNRHEEFAALQELAQVREHFLALSPDVQKVMHDANRSYVSWPSQDPTKPSPHATGGSIDVWLYRGGEPASLGVPFDWMEDNAGAFYHLRCNRKKFAGDARVCENRKRLLLAMLSAGFTCYPPEIWHFNFGNQMDALVRGGPARYSYIEP